MKLLVNTEVNTAGGCTDCRTVAFNSQTITAIRHSQLFLPVSHQHALLALLLNLVAEGMWSKPWMNPDLQHKLQNRVLTVEKQWHLWQNTAVQLIFSGLIKSQKLCCKGTTGYSGLTPRHSAVSKHFTHLRTVSTLGALLWYSALIPRGFLSFSLKQICCVAEIDCATQV